MENLFNNISEKVKAFYPTIIYPEGEDERILKSASLLSQKRILKPILIGNEESINVKMKKLELFFLEYQIIDPSFYPNMEKLISKFVICRNGKEDLESAKKKLTEVNYFGTMLVHEGIADGMVSGAIHTTADTIRPALQIIKTKEDIEKISGVFLMIKGDEKYIFGDCAINISPTSKELSEIVTETIKTSKVFDIHPRVAMLSFSTFGSAVSDETIKINDAIQILKKKCSDILIEGEIQFDAAFVPEVAVKKAPHSKLKGNANIFIFPNLEAGNIGYKIAQRLGGYEAIGPILQGLNKPVNDLSRGCSAEDVYKLSIITAMQAIQVKKNQINIHL